MYFTIHVHELRQNVTLFYHLSIRTSTRTCVYYYEAELTIVLLVTTA